MSNTQVDVNISRSSIDLESEFQAHLKKYPETNKLYIKLVWAKILGK